MLSKKWFSQHRTNHRLASKVIKEPVPCKREPALFFKCFSVRCWMLFYFCYLAKYCQTCYRFFTLLLVVSMTVLCRRNGRLFKHKWWFFCVCGFMNATRYVCRSIKRANASRKISLNLPDCIYTALSAQKRHSSLIFIFRFVN